MPGNTPEPLDQANTTKLFSAITQYHASLRKDLADVHSAFDNIVQMYVKEDEDKEFVYIYNPKYQPKYEKNMSVLQLKLSGVYSVVTDLSKELFPLKENILSKPNIVATKDNQNITYGQNSGQGQSILGKIKSLATGKSENINKIKDPWETTEDIIHNTLNIPNIFKMIVSTHARQYNRAFKFKGNLLAQQRIRRIEFNYFRGTAKGELYGLIGGRIDVVLRQEKPIVASVLSEVYRSAERNRMANMIKDNMSQG